MRFPPKAQRLCKEAREAATWRGHDLGRFVPDPRNDRDAIWRGEATCQREGCTAYVCVDVNPPINGVEIYGTAMGLNCPVEKRMEAN
jgi:hypothetical protein